MERKGCPRHYNTPYIPICSYWILVPVHWPLLPVGTICHGPLVDNDPTSPSMLSAHQSSMSKNKREKIWHNDGKWNNFKDSNKYCMVLTEYCPLSRHVSFFLIDKYQDFSWLPLNIFSGYQVFISEYSIFSYNSFTSSFITILCLLWCVQRKSTIKSLLNQDFVLQPQEFKLDWLKW